MKNYNYWTNGTVTRSYYPSGGLIGTLTGKARHEQLATSQSVNTPKALRHTQINPWSVEVISSTALRGDDMWYLGNGLYMFSQGYNVFYYPKDGPDAYYDAWTRGDMIAYERAYNQLTEEVRGGLDLLTSVSQLVVEESLLASTKRAIDMTVKAVDDLMKLKRRLVKNYALWSKLGRRRSGYSWRALTRTLKAVASWRLGYVYALNPLLEDIRKTAQYAGEVASGAVCEVSTAYSRPDGRGGNQIVDIRVHEPFDAYEYPNQYGWVRYQSTYASNSVRLSLRFAVEPGSLPDQARFTSVSVIPTAWELLPLSFVGDWFLDVGSYLRNLETAMIYAPTFRDGYEIHSWKFNWIASSDYNEEYKAIGCWSTQVTDGAERKGFTRTKLSSYPLPHMPVWNAPKFGAGRLLNAASLLTNLLSGAGSVLEFAQGLDPRKRR